MFWARNQKRTNDLKTNVHNINQSRLTACYAGVLCEACSVQVSIETTRTHMAEKTTGSSSVSDCAGLGRVARISEQGTADSRGKG